MDQGNGNTIKTIRISDKDKTRLIKTLNSSSDLELGHDPELLRVTPTHTNAVLRLLSDSNQTIQFSVVAYSHGRLSISLLHGRYIHPGIQCTVRFQSLSGAWCEHTGHTGQCIHIQGLIHAVSVVFDQPIDLDEFALLTSEQETRHLQEISQETPDLKSAEFAGLVSHVLYVDDDPNSRKLTSHWLNRAGMEVSTVPDYQTAFQWMQDNPFDLLILDVRYSHEEALDLVRLTRSSQFFQPILAVSVNQNKLLYAKAMAAGADEFLVKPFTEKQLARAAKHLLGMDVDGKTTPIYSIYSDDPEMAPLLTGYIRSLTNKIKILREANIKMDNDKIIHLAGGLKGCGIGYGYTEITSAATALLTAIEDEVPDLDEIKRLTNSLIMVLSRIKIRPAIPGIEQDSGKTG